MDEERKIPDFDFDVWSRIAHQDSEKFEAMRQQLINDLIEQAPSHLKQRMIGLQWQVDQIRRQVTNPMAGCLQISQRMWHSMLGEKGLLNTLREPKAILNSSEKEATGKILSFDRNKSSKQM